MAESTNTGRRKRQREPKRVLPTINQLDWKIPTYVDQPTEPLDADALARIDNAAMRILEEIGIDFLHPEAIQILVDAGCVNESGSQRVTMDRELVRSMVSKAPESFELIPRNPDRRIVWGGNTFTFGAVASPPNVSDIENGRRVGNRKDFQDLLRLSQTFNCIHFNSGYPVEPVDIHASVRHLDALFDKLTLTDKICHAYSLGPERVKDTIEMVRIAAGLSHDEFREKPRMFTNINSSSPLKHDWPMLDGAMTMARYGQPVVVAPFTLAGAMAPITLAGALAQQTAEALAAIVLLQIINPGNPVVFGAFTSNVDMKSGAPAFGTPEYVRAMQISGQLARHYKLPWRGSNANAANTPDAQSMWESMFSLMGSTSGQANMILHAAGWLEGGLTASFEKFIMDCEIIQQFMYYQQPISTSDDALAIDTIAEVGPNGHFLGCQHTQDRYLDAFYSPFLSDWSNYEAWEVNGAIDTPRRAHNLYKKLLKEFVPPPMDDATNEELKEFVERRRREGGAKTDF